MSSYLNPEKSTSSILEVQDLSVTFANGSGSLRAVQDLNFTVAAQEFVCVLGPSGSGKSTLLRVLAGLLKPTRGSFTLSHASPEQHQPQIGIVFQDANLMPWRSAIENICLPLELAGVKKATAYKKAAEMIALVGLQGFENSWPRDLSGGMAQRVAIARALIQDPQLLLLDEPFGALDALNRELMGAELLQIWQARRKTVLMVTHSISEALLLSDRVLVFTPRPGRIALDLQVDLPRPREEAVRYTSEFNALSRKLRAALT